MENTNGDVGQSQTNPAQSEVETAQTEGTQVAIGELPPSPIEKGATEQPATELPPQKVEAPVEYNLKIPENSRLTQEEVEGVTSFAKKYGLSPEDAQELLVNENGFLMK